MRRLYDAIRTGAWIFWFVLRGRITRELVLARLSPSFAPEAWASTPSELPASTLHPEPHLVLLAHPDLHHPSRFSEPRDHSVRAARRAKRETS